MGVWHKKECEGGGIDGRLIKLTGNVGGRTSDADVGACHGERLEGVPSFCLIRTVTAGLHFVTLQDPIRIS